MVSDGKVTFQAEVDMGGHLIKNVKDGVDKNNCVNVGQLESGIVAGKNRSTPWLNSKQPKSFYNTVFDLCVASQRVSTVTTPVLHRRECRCSKSKLQSSVSE